MRLHGGPADGRDIPAPRDGWAWVDVDGDRLRIYDIGRPEDQQHQDRPRRGSWGEYVYDPEHPGALRYSRTTPPRAI